MSHWLRSYRLLVRWRLLELRTEIVVLVVVQAALTTGVVVGLAFLLPNLQGAPAKFLATGAPTLNLAIVGLVLGPQSVANAKRQGTFDYIWSLPVPRLAHLAANLTAMLMIALPGVVIALIVAALRFQFALTISPWVLLAVPLVALTAASVGYAIAYSSPSPEVTVLIAQVVLFGVFMFSPLLYPIERLPAGLAAVHRVLPVKYMADAVRGTVTDLQTGSLMQAFAMLSAWCVAGLSATYAVARRRR